MPAILEMIVREPNGEPKFVDDLQADLHRFVFLLGVSDGEELFGEPAP